MTSLTSLLLAKYSSAGRVCLVYYAESQNSRACVGTAAFEQSIFKDKMLLQLFAWNSSSTILFVPESFFSTLRSLAVTVFSAALHFCDPLFSFPSSFISQYFHFRSLHCLMPTFSLSIIPSCPSVWGLVSLGL